MFRVHSGPTLSSFEKKMTKASGEDVSTGGKKEKIGGVVTRTSPPPRDTAHAITVQPGFSPLQLSTQLPRSSPCTGPPLTNRRLTGNTLHARHMMVERPPMRCIKSNETGAHAESQSQPTACSFRLAVDINKAGNSPVCGGRRLLPPLSFARFLDGL